MVNTIINAANYSPRLGDMQLIEGTFDFVGQTDRLSVLKLFSKKEAVLERDDGSRTTIVFRSMKELGKLFEQMSWHPSVEMGFNSKCPTYDTIISIITSYITDLPERSQIVYERLGSVASVGVLVSTENLLTGLLLDYRTKNKQPLRVFGAYSGKHGKMYAVYNMFEHPVDSTDQIYQLTEAIDGYINSADSLLCQ